MKKLQSSFTTPNQSKRLLELGVPKNSANLYYNKFGALEAIPEYRNFNEFCDASDTPCWSVGRLMEIILLCHVGRILGVMYHGKCVIDELIIEIEKRKEVNEIDFSKLEE